MSIDELRQAEGELKSRIEHLHEFLHIDDRKAEMAELEAKMSAPDFWNDKESAQNTVSQLSACRNLLEPFRKLESEIEDYSVALELAGEDEEFLKETEIAYRRLLKSLDRMEIMSFLSGKFDRNNLYFSVHAGAGGTESCDWASMLLRMYRRFFERRGWKDEVIDLQPGEEAGVKSATLHVTGEFAYGYMKGEKGVHRLVRISPFDSNARRHTSFVSVDVFPELDDDIDIEIDETQLRIDTYRSSGAGGQHVNTTDSAIRITHLPTGIVVCCQNERSQHKNRATAMKMLKAKLYEYEEEKRRSEADAIRGEKMENGWGSQIRSYVLQPYQMVKDLRTEVETSNTAGVLDGEIDEFIEAFLKAKK
ncbi:peptide chain release factor 2 [Victivallaceae bacterium BBE-744-WT-12]|uniref:Peptide chain release factor 2 n=1 Tax=Victivallis lenta TaxID=2606640 RepID=A0A844G5C0_9BACT|nr:peptide chain release factor 2 [Victivallis lenta]AVM47230.1 peptide chain release factor 2 [Victivallales bacterium CCUG 44730]MST97791.1 peptide chain release factor 2 [Victivallis lenta]HBP07512.1 peptide chain release factor 2 [Lentisphaeria bacterium]HCH85956.1 peptide chain release factor 2 [Lentisphaeria bacterium]